MEEIKLKHSFMIKNKEKFNKNSIKTKVTFKYIYIYFECQRRISWFEIKLIKKIAKYL